jgi:hypothetical protein
MITMGKCTWIRRRAPLDIIVKRPLDKTPVDFFTLACAPTLCVFEKLDTG